MIRQAERADLDYILSSWQLTYEKSPEMSQPGMIRDEYFRLTHLVLDELISRASAKGSLYIDCVDGAPHLIRGYLCAEAYTEPDIAYVHWAQTKKKYWGQGIATNLVNTFIRDFGVTEEQNLLYTFSSRAMACPGFANKATERFPLVYWPWFKYTSQEFGWESGRIRG
jgi:ribosomal protein S18 acetylase RimI-like enzyme